MMIEPLRECDCYDVKDAMGATHEMTCAKCVHKIITGQFEHTQEEKDLSNEAFELLKKGCKRNEK